jgi:hypothetical protein
MYAAIRRGMLPSRSINTFIKQAAGTFASTLTALPDFVDYYIMRVGTFELLAYTDWREVVSLFS